MIVGKIWDSEYPWDVRVEKVAGALTRAGHEVHLVCRNRRDEAPREVVGGIHVHRMARWRGPMARWDNGLSFPAFVNPRWYRLAHSVFSEQRADVIMCRDLPLAPLGLAVGRALNRPVVLDIAEHYPGLLADLYNAHDFRPGNLVVRNPWLAATLEREVLPRADAVLVVVEEMGERLERMGVRHDRITVVSNTPTRERIDMMGAVTPPPHGGREPRLVYLGNVERSRGIAVVLEALALLRRSGGNARLDVFGDGTSYQSDRRLAATLGLGDVVTFHGRRPYEEILAALPTFDAGVIPHHATDHWNFTIQNKMFDYMAAGLPVVVSSMPPAARIVNDVGSGLVFRDRDPEDLARLLGAFPGPEARAAMGAAGRRAVVERYNWDRDGERLVRATERAAFGNTAALKAGA
jgi:glycosyltransferase involved in cell wall biosynthesis